MDLLESRYNLEIKNILYSEGKQAHIIEHNSKLIYLVVSIDLIYVVFMPFLYNWVY